MFAVLFDLCKTLKFATLEVLEEGVTFFSKLTIKNTRAKFMESF